MRDSTRHEADIEGDGVEHAERRVLGTSLRMNSSRSPTRSSGMDTSHSR